MADAHGWVADFEREVTERLRAIGDDAARGGLEPAVELLASAIRRGGVLQAFGTGHSEAFALELAGGLVATNRIALRDAVLYGDRAAASLAARPPLERDPAVAAELFTTIERHPEDAFVIASSSGVNGAVVGLALLAREAGHRVVGVTSMAHTARVAPKHPSGQRLADVADIVLDNHAPYGDATLEIGGASVGAVSSITAAYLAQLLSIGVADRLAADGPPPVYLSANVPGGDEHNIALEAGYAGRIRRSG